MGKKKVFSMIATLLIGIIPFTSCAQNNKGKEQNMDNKKKLVVYFSRTGENYAVGNIKKGNTHIIADMIAEEGKCDTFQIVPAVAYPDDYNKCIDVAKKEQESRARPTIKGDVKIEDYDIIFIGYPNWWGDMPMPVYTFIEKHNWQGKTIIPFCTHEGSGLGSTDSKLKAACQGATMLKGLAVQGFVAQNQQSKAKENVSAWLKGLKY